ncbi:MAG: HAD family phosphatase [Firmicutes bacterium]|nr:HAD family phosphatase [Bacillota bacterium]
MRGAIFDIDGTILNSMTMWIDVTTKFLSDFDVYLTPRQCEIFQTMTLEESLPMIRDKYDIKMSEEEIRGEFKRLVTDEYKTTVQAKPYAAEYVKKLYADGVKIAVATSGYEDLWRPAFERFGIDGCVSAAAYSAEVGVNKSNPDVYLLAAKRIDVEPSDCVVFEDIVPGINGAKKGGFKTCAVWDSSNENQTAELKRDADRYIKSFKELM